jgi:hypothetical protein
MRSPSRFRLASLVDTWMLRVALLAWAVALVNAVWDSGPVSRWFTAIAGATTVAATLPFLGQIGIRRTRFIAGATTASAGAILTLQLGVLFERPEVGDPKGLSGAMALALLTAAFGGWIAEERLGRLAHDEALHRDELAERRHNQVLAAVEGSPRPRERLRASELALGALAVALLRRR